MQNQLRDLEMMNMEQRALGLDSHAAILPMLDAPLGMPLQPEPEPEKPHPAGQAWIDPVWVEQVRETLSDVRGRCCVVVVLWFAIGVVMYSFFPSDAYGKQYSFIEATYLMVQILTTIGYGDVLPKTQIGKICTSVFVLGGVVVIASIVGVLTDVLVRRQAMSLHSAVIALELQIEDQAIPDPQKASDRMARLQWFSPETHEFFESFFLWLAFVFAGTCMFSMWPGEERSPVEAFYMSVITLTTVGFGDSVPHTQTGKFFAIFWMLAGVASLGHMLHKFAVIFFMPEPLQHLNQSDLKRISDDPLFLKCHGMGHGGMMAGMMISPRTGQQFFTPRGAEKNRSCFLFEQAEYADSLPWMDELPEVTRADFILFMLRDARLVDDSIIAKFSQNFDRLDKNGSGTLDMADLENVSFTTKAQKLKQQQKGKEKKSWFRRFHLPAGLGRGGRP
eukprot:TRINITY_DN122712_c0_g1_i1.p1 TRINITY_DN122712_c0_g1~~TRINITY_DN122712_c0_g1_i1.p1  ORF type:complete len:472 (+),score=70.82 TRINITY_DN122712_c0_g1_i1:74-1417(+)